MVGGKIERIRLCFGCVLSGIRNCRLRLDLGRFWGGCGFIRLGGHIHLPLRFCKQYPPGSVSRVGGSGGLAAFSGCCHLRLCQLRIRIRSGGLILQGLSLGFLRGAPVILRQYRINGSRGSAQGEAAQKRIQIRLPGLKSSLNPTAQKSTHNVNVASAPCYRITYALFSSQFS